MPSVLNISPVLVGGVRSDQISWCSAVSQDGFLLVTVSVRPFVPSCSKQEPHWNLKLALQSTSPFSPSFPLTTTVSAFLFVPAPLFSCFSFFPCSLVKAFCPHLRPVSKWLNMRKPVARIRDKSFDTASLLFNSFFKYCYKNISLPLLGTNGFHQGTENSLLCSNVLPDFRAGYSPSLSKCYCDVKTAARCFWKA